MKNFLLLFFTCIISVSTVAQRNARSVKMPLNVTTHGIAYPDDYAWLENVNAENVKEWVASENDSVAHHLEKVKKVTSSISKIRDYDALSTNSFPTKKGRYFYSLYRKEKDSPLCLFYRKKLTDQSIEIVNPAKIYKGNNNAMITNYYPSKNSKLVAYKVSLDGSDRQEIRFIEPETFKNLEDVLTNVKYSSVAWNKSAGVFYKKNSNMSKFAQDSTYQLFYHKIGTGQIADELIFDTTTSQNSFSFSTMQNKLFIIEQNKAETHKTYYYAELDDETPKLKKFLENEPAGFNFLNYHNGRVYFSTKDYIWGEIRSADINNMTDQKVVIPQIYMHLMVDSYSYEDYIVCKYRTLGKNYISVYDANGGFIRKFEAPFGMDFSVKFLDPETKDLYVSFFSYTIPFIHYKLNLESGSSDVYYNNYLRPKPTLFPFDYFETKTITYKSRDNVDVPITIIHKKGITLDGKNPTLLKAYGGFGMISGPSYDTGILYFLEKGGVFAYAEIRGGGEKGLKWHRDGKGLKKMNTFNDFIDAAEFLIKEKYTSPDKLAITGTSQGGVLVGVAMTQRPDLFKVAIPRMGVYDMAKFDQYTVGKSHLDEYGNPAIKEEFQSLMAYSPYHNIKENVNYPTTMIITSENDDRTPPIHSYKFAARLQERVAQKNPIYIKVLGNSGHGGKISNYKNFLDEKADFYNFLWYHLNR